MTALLERLRGLLVCSAVFIIPLVFWPWSHDSYRVVKQAGLALYLVPALGIWLAAGGPGLSRVPRPYLYCVGGFMAWNFLRMLGAPDITSASIRAGEWLLAFCAAGAVLGLDERGRRRALYCLVAGTAAAALWGMAQNVFGAGFMVPYRVDPRSVTFTSERIFSTFGNPVFFAGYLILVFPLTLGLAFEAGGRSRAGGYLLLAAAGLQLVALAFTSSRGAFLGLGAGMIYLFFKSPELGRHKLRLAGLGILILAAIGLLRPALTRHLFTPGDPGRILMWRTAARMWGDMPLLGAGLGQFARAYPCVMRELAGPAEAEAGADAWHAHNEYLQAGAETGTPGVVLLVLLIGGLMIARPAEPAGRGIQAGVLAVAVNAVFNFPFHIPPIQAFVWMAPALAFFGPGFKAPEPRRRHAAWLLAGLAAALWMRPFLRSSYVQWGLAYQDAGRRARADICLEKAQILMQDDARERISYHRGKNAFEAGEIDAAERNFRKDKSDFPCHAEGFGNLAVIYGMRAQRGEQGALVTALGYITDAIALRPSGREAAGNYNTLGNLRVLAGDEAGAIKAYKRSLACDPGFVEGAANLIRLLLRRGDRREAARIYDEVSGLAPDDREFAALGEVLRRGR